MKVFIYEYICGGGLAGQLLPESLANEGWAMLSSAVQDFASIDLCEVLTTIDERLASRSLAARFVKRLGAEPGNVQHAREAGGAERKVIESLAAQSDWSLIIAPETDGVLYERVRWVEQVGGRLLGPSSIAVALAADKLQCGRHLKKHGVPALVGETVNLDDLARQAQQFSYPLVIKPRDGAGSQATCVIRDSGSLAAAAAHIRQNGSSCEFLMQPYIHGIAVSASFLVGPRGLTPLLAGEQLFGDSDWLHYCGGRIPLDAELARRAIELGHRAASTIPGLNGYVGVDMLLGKTSVLKSEISHFKLNVNSCQTDVVIDINPRLTTSYVGLRVLSRNNLAERMLQTVEGKAISPIEWHVGPVGFSADGRVAYCAAGPGSSA